MPYESARTAELAGTAYEALGDRASADLEYDNAAEAYRELGADHDLERVVGLRSGPNAGEPAGEPTVLTDREREVLGHVAAGCTNREIAAALTISQHTVGRHLENIFAKLGVTSRTAATAHAYEHGLL